MNNNVQNVTYGGVKATGVIYSAPLGTTLPENANDELNSAFVNLGYISDSGITEPSTNDAPESIRADGGDVVLTTPAEFNKTITAELLEVLNPDVLKEVYGAENVETTDDLVAFVEKNYQGEDKSYIIETVMTGNRIKRKVIPSGVLTKTGDVVEVYNDAVKIPITITAKADETGAYTYNYIA